MNIIDKILSIRLLDGVLQFTSSNNKWKVLVNAVEERTSGFNLLLSDVGKYIRVNSADTVAITIDNDEFPVGGTVTFEQAGSGAITLSSSTETLNGNPVSAGQYKCIQVIKVGIKTWTIIGGIAGD